MMRSQTPTLATFAVIAGAALFLAAIAFWVYDTENRTTDLVTHTQDVINAGINVRAGLVDIQSAYLGYVITGSERYLDGYRKSVGDVNRDFASLRTLTADNPQQQTRLVELDQAIRTWSATVDKIVVLRTSGAVDEAENEIGSHQPQEQMDRVRLLLGNIEAVEQELLKSRSLAHIQSVRWLLWTLVGFVLIVFGGLAFTYHQVRRRLAAHEQLAVNEERLRLMTQNTVGYAIFMLDTEGQVISWNAGARKIKGYTDDEIIGADFSRFYTEEDRIAGKPAHSLQVAATDGRFEEEAWRVRKDGTRFWAHVVITAMRDASGALRGFGKVTRDLTERRRAEEAMRAEIDERRRVQQQLNELNVSLEQRVAEQTAHLEAQNTELRNDKVELAQAQSTQRDLQERLTGIIDSAMDALITVDESQRIILFNTAAERIFGCPQSSALGARLESFIPERYRHHHAEYVRDFGKTGITSRQMGNQRIVMGLRRDGEEFPIEASISQLEQDGKKFFTVILRDVTQRVRAETRLRESQAELHELASSAQTAREQEKSRIARELHDELGQLLSSLRVDLGLLKTDLTLKEHIERINGMESLLDRSVAETRRIASDLRPLILDDLGLVPAVEWLTQMFKQRTGIDCVLRVSPADLDLFDPYATAIYRIVQESLTNVAKHARASLVTVTLEQQDAEIFLSIRDNGQGFEPSDPRKPLSFGLVGLRERAYFVGGSVAVESTLGQGTTVRTRIPLASAATA